MKNAIKGMILFFSVLLVSLVALIIYGLVGSANGFSGFGGSFDSLSERHLANTLTADLTDITELVISVSSEDVFLMQSDSQEIIVKEYISSRSDRDPRVTLERQGNKVRIASTRPKVRSWFVFGSNYRYVEIYLPQSYQAGMRIGTSSGDIFGQYGLKLTACEADTASGDIDFERLEAEKISLGTASGDITVVACTGETRMTTTSGDVVLDEVEGRVKVNTSSGHVQVQKINGYGEVTTSSGDIELEFSKLNGNLDIGTSSGDVYCELPQTAGFAFTATTSSGDIETDFDDRLQFNRKGNQAEGRVGDAADVKVKVSTSSGDVEFYLR